MRYYHEGHFVDGNGRAIQNGTVTVYLAGTTTLATIYSTLAGLTPISGSVLTTEEDGKFSFFIKASSYSDSQKYKLVLSKTNYISKTYDNIDVNTVVLESTDTTTDIPGFHAYVSATIPNQTGNNTTYTIIFDKEYYDSDGAYSITTGQYTAKQSGPFDFFATICLSGLTSGATTGVFQIVQVRGVSVFNSTTMYVNPYAMSVGGTTISINLASHFYLLADDIIYVTANVNGVGSDAVDIEGGEPVTDALTCHFSGHMVTR